MKIYTSRREKLLKSVSNNSVTILFSSDADNEDGRFNINRNFYYLTGIDKKEMILVLFNLEGEFYQTLFIQPYDEKEALWVGGRITCKEASAISGIKNILELEDFNQYIHELFSRYRNKEIKVYLDCFEDEEKNISKSSNYGNVLLKKYPFLEIKDIFPFITKMRLIKDEYEVECIKKANQITKKAIEKMMKTIKPNLNEMVMEGVFTYACSKQLCNEFSFKTIAASGERATILHYSDNNQPMKNGELFLQDLGATYNHYCADVTRTYPVNGKFTKRQKELYQIVLNAQKIVESSAKPGISIRKLNSMVIEYYKKELPKVGLNKKVSEYYYHNISHHLGLDCHDADAGLGDILQEGNVISNEPGLYIVEEGIGIRIEDDLLITEDGVKNLSEGIIKEIIDIEKYMK